MCVHHGLAWSGQAEHWLVASNGKVVEYTSFYFGYRPHLLKSKRGDNYSGIGNFSFQISGGFSLAVQRLTQKLHPPKIKPKVVAEPVRQFYVLNGCIRLVQVKILDDYAVIHHSIGSVCHGR